MERLFSLWDKEILPNSIQPQVVKYVLEKTHPGVTLRTFSVDLKHAEGPLHANADSQASEEWVEKRRKGGHWLVELLKVGGLHNWDSSKAPYRLANHFQFLV